MGGAELVMFEDEADIQSMTETTGWLKRSERSKDA
jgi:hypothetical protein